MDKNNSGYKTDSVYWEKYWENTFLPSRLNPNITCVKAIMDVLLMYLPKDDKQTTTVLEIGCAPGRWLVYFYEEFGYLPFGIEYLESAVETTIKNMNLCEIFADKSTINCSNFFAMDHNNAQKHDIGMSDGVIEHFYDPLEIIKMQMAHLKIGVYLIIAIPKFTCLNKSLLNMTDRYSGLDILNTHNLDIMNISYFKELSKKLDREEVFVGNVGGFEPGILLADGLPKYLYAIILVLNKLFHCLFISKMNQEWISGYILGIYKKN